MFWLRNKKLIFKYALLSGDLTYGIKYFFNKLHWYLFNTLHTVWFMHRLSISLIKRISHRDHVFLILYVYHFSEQMQEYTNQAKIAAIGIQPASLFKF